MDASPHTLSPRSRLHNSSEMTLSPLFLSFLFLSLSVSSRGQVPEEGTFQFVNEGYLFDAYNEYEATYRSLNFDRYSDLFALALYNTTPDQFYLGLRMGTPFTDSALRWVWDANRGHPVGENATVTFGRDGNLVLAEADGRVVWSTGTANKGAVGIRILPTGNIVIYDKHGKHLWQSFDHPTDTLMVGQSLYVTGRPNKLVSRRSDADNSDGIYSLMLHRKGFDLYINSSSNKSPMQYSDGRFNFAEKTVTNATLVVVPVNNGAAYEVSLRTDAGKSLYTRPKYNATFSILRLEMNGNLVVYTYYIPVDYLSWERSYEVFGYDVPACRLPSTCGDLGVCNYAMCVACPTAKGGLMGWSESCKPPALGVPCKRGAHVDYYKVAKVVNYIPSYNKGLGKMKVEECRRRCSSDCECLGFFYWEETSQCWLADRLGSLYDDSYPSHLLYIKYLK